MSKCELNGTENCAGHPVGVVSLTFTGQILKEVLIPTAEFYTGRTYGVQSVAVITGQGEIDTELHTSGHTDIAILDNWGQTLQSCKEN